MYEKFTPHARKVIGQANQEAQRLKDEYIGSVHVLLSLLQDDGVAATILKNLKVDSNILRQEVEKAIQHGDNSSPSDARLPISPGVKDVINTAMEETAIFEHHWLGTEHLLLGLLHQRDNIVAEALKNSGLTLENVRSQLQSLIGPSVCGREMERRGSKIDKPADALTVPDTECPYCGQPLLQQKNWSFVRWIRRIIGR